jgi:hypothetical protein
MTARIVRSDSESSGTITTEVVAEVDLAAGAQCAGEGREGHCQHREDEK